MYIRQSRRSLPEPMGDTTIPAGFIVLFVIVGLIVAIIIICFIVGVSGLGRSIQHYTPCPELASETQKVIAVDMGSPITI